MAQIGWMSVLFFLLGGKTHTQTLCQNVFFSNFFKLFFVLCFTNHKSVPHPSVLQGGSLKRKRKKARGSRHKILLGTIFFCLFFLLLKNKNILFVLLRTASLLTAVSCGLEKKKVNLNHFKRPILP